MSSLLKPGMADKTPVELKREVATLRRQLAQCQRSLCRYKKAENEVRSKRSPSTPTKNLGQAERSAPEAPAEDERLAGLVHELRQPLTALVNYAAVCLDLVRTGQADNPDLRHGLEQALLQAERAAELLGNARRVACPTALRRCRLRIDDSIREAIQLLEGDLRTNNIKVDLNVADSLTEIQADPVQLRVVLLNLLRNAIEALAGIAGERAIAISVRERAAEIEVAIRDTGVGLSLQAVHNLFEPFQTTKADGTGIGLALSRAIVQSHGGRLWAKPQSNRGTTFFFTLPKN